MSKKKKNLPTKSYIPQRTRLVSAALLFARVFPTLFDDEQDNLYREALQELETAAKEFRPGRGEKE